MKTSRRVFVAAWEYPPLISGESIVCRKTLEHSRLDYDLCCGPAAGAGDRHIRLFPQAGNKYLLWPLQVLRQFLALDRREHYSVMMSRVMPVNGHLAGWLIKRLRPGLKWVVYFSDPVWNSPFLSLPWKGRGDHRPSWLLMKLFGIPAKWAVREGDLLVFNNERLARYVLGKEYGRFQNKVLIAPYGHDGLRLRPAPQRGDGQFWLTHVGQLYGNRTLEAITEALQLLQRREPELFRRLRVWQVGFASASERRRVEQSALSGTFGFVGQVSYKESIQEMYRADCLLVIDPVFQGEGQNIYVPGKLYDYLSVGRPILCIADRDSATGDIARETGCRIVPPQAEALCAVLKDLLEGSGFPPPDPQRCGQLHCRVGAGRLDEKIEKLMRREG